jgi:hypothetical protein
MAAVHAAPLRLFAGRLRETSLRIFLAFGIILLMSGAASAATITVTNTLDSGTGSLRAALASANSGDVIDLSGVVGTITLDSILTINQSVTINGPGANQLTISGNNKVGVFTTALALTVTISGVTIAHGASQEGAGMFFRGANGLTINNCTFSDNVATSPFALNVGGAI